MMEKTGGNTLLDINFILKKTQIKERMKIADLGCGTTGHFIFPVSKLIGSNGTVYAVDVVKNTLETIKRRAKQESTNNIITIWSNIEVFKATKINSESLDIALLINTLYQSDKTAKIIRETTRMIKKNGKLLIVDWEKTDSPLGPPSNKKISTKILKDICKKLGLKLEEEFNAGRYHYGLLFTKL